MRSRPLYPGSFQILTNFKEPHPLAVQSDLLVLAFMQLLELYVYHLDLKYMKLTIGYNMFIPSSRDLSVTLGEAIPLHDGKSSLIPKRKVYDAIWHLVSSYAELYQEASIRYLKCYGRGPDNSDLPGVKSLKRKKPRKSKIITSIKRRRSEIEPRPFIVADTETVIVNDVHVPYAIGFMTVFPEKDLCSSRITTFFSEDLVDVLDRIDLRSARMLSNFIYDLGRAVRRNSRLRTIFLHNLSRFDGILLLKHLTAYHNEYRVKALLRNNRIYEIKVYSGKRLLFRFRDSLNFFPRSLRELADTFCPELGSKGSIDHDAVSVSNRISLREEYVSYLRQDILILGGVMQKAQALYLSKYNVDVEAVMTISGLSLRIFRANYYKPDLFPISTLTKNEDTFIRRGYYGGHSDVYKPFGENLLFYDVNSLYPFVMKNSPMPCGIPVWKNNLEQVDLSTLFGFIEAIAICPKDLNRPFLPYKNPPADPTLIFGTCHVVGVYFSEELKYAHQLGYDITPLRGYLFDKMNDSPFASIISSLYELRKQAKKDGSEVI
ncbi:hypothetical protein ZIOFF_060114 [Zingiber officinale]|uniref:DNA-directed DNA polymerase n=1 Tax=Zingiber officinale TaxID=94328 RepID=A0A8J5ENF8_ZINOF|nr:hypothetical protein ZIOFF_075478 [Zingiber officinale]KAG6467626.1 hypothetical protein ZIOFF_074523 [Zingiber officinale]KAG6483467.1 hypothetical protein ZIOFF_060114 [Zingiber officinale]